MSHQCFSSNGLLRISVVSFPFPSTCHIPHRKHTTTSDEPCYGHLSNTHVSTDSSCHGTRQRQHSITIIVVVNYALAWRSARNESMRSRRACALACLAYFTNHHPSHYTRTHASMHTIDARDQAAIYSSHSISSALGKAQRIHAHKYI